MCRDPDILSIAPAVTGSVRPSLVTFLAITLLAGCDGTTADESDEAERPSVSSCGELEDCPAVDPGVSALLFLSPQMEHPALVGGEASLAAFYGQELAITPLLWGGKQTSDHRVVVQVTGYDASQSVEELVAASIPYQPSPGGKFTAPTFEIVPSERHQFLLITTSAVDENGTPFGILDATLRVDLFEPALAGEVEGDITVPLRVWRVRSSDDRYGCVLSEAQLAAYFAETHRDPRLPLTINEIYSQVGVSFSAEVDTLVVPPEWDFMARRVPCDQRDGFCFRTRRRLFSELFGDPRAINVFVVGYSAQDDRPPRESDDIQDSLLGLTHQLTYTQAPSGPALPGAWLSSKIWLSDRDTRIWPSRVIAHEVGHAFDMGHHRRLSSRLLMTPTSSAEPTGFVAGSAIMDLPAANQYFSRLRTHTGDFVESLGRVERSKPGSN